MLMLTRGMLFAAALSLYAASANALSFTLDTPPVGPVVSENGELEFSNFQFFSPFNSVNASQVTATVLADGIQLSGPISATDTLKNFFVLYEVRSLGAGIDGASLLLDSDVDTDDFGLVFSTKQILGEVGGPPGHGKNGPPGLGGDGPPGLGGDGPPGLGGNGPPGLGGDGPPGLSKHGDDFDFGLDLDHGFPTDRQTLAFLKTADWEIDDENNCFRTPFGIGSDGAIRLVEGGFDPQPSIRVIDGVTVTAWDGTATWSSSTNRYTLAPEPSTASLMLLGLGGLAFFVHGRRR